MSTGDFPRREDACGGGGGGGGECLEAHIHILSVSRGIEFFFVSVSVYCDYLVVPDFFDFSPLVVQTRHRCAFVYERFLRWKTKNG